MCRTLMSLLIGLGIYAGAAPMANAHGPHGSFAGGGFVRPGFNQGGFNRPGFNPGGFNRPGFNRNNAFNPVGYNRPGFNRPGFNRPGFNRANMLTRNYRNWSRRCWLPNCGCSGYYCPDNCVWYYWYGPGNCYLPIDCLSTYPPDDSQNVAPDWSPCGGSMP